jgi:predicted esterase
MFHAASRRSLLDLLGLLACLAVVAASAPLGRAADDPPAKAGPIEATRLEGKILHKANVEDVRLLGIMARGMTYDSKQGERLTPEQQQLAVLSAKAFQANDWDNGYRYITRFILLRRGLEVNEASEVATAYDLKLDRKLVMPGETIEVRLEPVFTLGCPLSGVYRAKLSLRDSKGELVEDLKALDIKEIGDIKKSVSVPAGNDGRWTVGYELQSPTGQTLIQGTREFLVAGSIGPRLAILTEQLRQLRDSADTRGVPVRAALETLEYLVDTFERARKSYVAPMLKQNHPMIARLRGTALNRPGGDLFNLDEDLRLAEHLAAGLLAGKSPLATRTGDLRQAYRSPVDGTLQPYRVYVPRSYDPAKKYPLVVALHGATGDENSYMDFYLDRKTGKSLFKTLGEERGYVLVTPCGRGPYGMYQGPAEQDVLDVLERVKQVYSINPKQVFMTGHSMGATGTWSIGFKYPDRFAALAPVAGRPQNIDGIGLKNAPEMPVLFACGTRDNLATPEATRQLARIAEKELKHFRHLETADDHLVIGVTSMPDIFDFFDKLRAGTN